MKKLIILLFAFALNANAQTFPVNNLTVAGTSSFTGASAFTVGPTMPTASPGTNTTQGASTAFVGTAISALSSIYAPIASPTFTGTSTFNGPANFNTSTTYGGLANFLSTVAFNSTTTGVTPAVGNNSTQIATTAYVAGNKNCSSILDFGGNNTGGASNNTALTNVIAANQSGQVCVFFPAGTYNFSSNFSFTFPSNLASITFLGAGADVTKLVWAAGGGMTFNFVNDNNSVHIRDMALLTGTTNAGPAIYLNETNTITLYNAAVSDITNVTIRGSDGYVLTDYWSEGVRVNGVSNINFVGLDVNGNSTFNGGNGVDVFGTASNVGVVYNFQGCYFAGLNNGIIYGTEIQGMTISQSNFTNVQVGIGVPASGVNQSQLNISNSQFNALSAAILVSSAVLPISISDNFILVNTNGNGIYLNPSSTTTITGNVFQNNLGATNITGVAFVSYQSFSSIVTGNQFTGLTNAINLTSGAHNVNVQSNSYSGNGTNVVNNCAGGCTVGGGSQ